MPTDSAASRRYDLDWVRIGAFALLILYHVGMYYVSWDWHVKSPQASPALEPLMILTAPWRLSLLFLVSGVATAYLLERQPRHFLGSRSWRLLLPLAVGMLVIVPPQVYYELAEKAPAALRGGYMDFWARYARAEDMYCAAPGDCIDGLTWNHLWFVAYLWAYTVVLWGLTRWPGALETLRCRSVLAMGGIGILLWPMLWLVVARVLLVGRFESTHDLIDDWYNHAQYFGVFLLGFLVARTGAVWDTFVRSRWAALIVALGSYGLLAWYFATFTDGNPPADSLRDAQRLLWGVNQWASIVAVLGFARAWAPGDSPALRYLTEAVFPVYILHQTVIVVFAHNLKPFGIAPGVEGPLLVLANFVACFAAFEVIRRVGWLRPLFGLSPRRQAQHVDAAVHIAPSPMR